MTGGLERRGFYLAPSLRAGWVVDDRCPQAGQGAVQRRPDPLAFGGQIKQIMKLENREPVDERVEQ